MEKVRILLLSTGRETYGTLSFIDNLVNDMVEGEMEVTIYTITGKRSDLKSEKKHEEKIKSISASRRYDGKSRFGYVLNSILCFLSINKILREHKIDFICTQYPLDIPLLAILGGGRKLKKYWFMPSYISKRRLGWNRILFRIILKIGKITPIGNSYSTLYSLMGEKARRYKVLYPKINVGDDFLEFRKKGSLKNETLKICCIARIEKKKCQVNIVNAITILKNLNIQVVLAGGGNDEEIKKINKLIKENKLENKVKLMGYLEDVKQLYNVSHLSINLYDGEEGFGISVVEAMACGIPVLANRSGGMQETVIEGFNGFFVDNVDSQTIAMRIREIYNKKELLEEMGSDARGYVKEKFSVVAHKNNLENLFVKFN